MAIVILILSLLSCACNWQQIAASSGYVETGDCKGEQLCHYNYAVDQQYFEGEVQQNVSVKAVVEVTCNSVGLFQGEDSRRYCIEVTKTSMDGTMFSGSTEAEKRGRQTFTDQYLSGLFCFVQVSTGKVVAIHHPPSENVDAINFKKAIAAAFQANFKGTEEEEEDDLQSAHKAHYSYETTGDEQQKMHRSVSSDDVLAYSTGISKKDVDLRKEEDVDYRSGTLYHSSGDTTVVIVDKEKQEIEEKDTYSAHGTFSLDLIECFALTRSVHSRHRRSVASDLNEDMVVEKLIGTIDEETQSKLQLEQLRKDIPDVYDALVELHNNPDNMQLNEKLQRLMELELKSGTQSDQHPAVNVVINYLINIHEATAPEDVTMRTIIYSLLSGEGSLQSQMILRSALDIVTTDDEGDVLLVQISFIEKPSSELIAGLEQHILDNSTLKGHADSLVLSYGAVASKASPELQAQMVHFLLEYLDQLSDTVEEGGVTLVDVIYSMGNTGSNLVLDTILSYLDHLDEDVRLAAISSLRKFIDNEVVLDTLTEMLSSDPSEEYVIAITNTLTAGLDYSLDVDSYIDKISQHPLLAVLAATTVEFNNTDLHSMVKTLLTTLTGKDSIILTRFNAISDQNARRKRGSNWDASNSLYDLVASQSARRSDELSYPKHTAYIWAKEFGVSRVKVQVAGGVFAGVSRDCDNIKVFGKAVAKGHLFSRSRTVADIELRFMKTSSAISAKAYVNLGGNVLLDYTRSRDIAGCLRYSRSLFSQKFQILRFQYSVFVYVGTIDFYVSLYVTVGVSFDASLCGSTSVNDLVNANAGLTPRVSVTAEGGVSVTLLLTVRGGVAVDATLTYQLEPILSGKACAAYCTPSFQTCAGLYDSWPANSVNLYAYHQIRSVKFCRKWGIPYPCGFKWGSRKKWSAFSKSWSLGQRGRTRVWERCYGTNNPTCQASPAG